MKPKRRRRRRKNRTNNEISETNYYFSNQKHWLYSIQCTQVNITKRSVCDQFSKPCTCFHSFNFNRIDAIDSLFFRIFRDIRMNGKRTHKSFRAGIVIILLLFYLNWSEWNDMHIANKSIVNGKCDATWKPCDTATAAKTAKSNSNKRKKNDQVVERVTIACQIEWKMYEKIIEIVIIIITRAKGCCFFPSWIVAAATSSSKNSVFF